MNLPVIRTVEKMKRVCKNPFILGPSQTQIPRATFDAEHERDIKKARKLLNVIIYSASDGLNDGNPHAWRVPLVTQPNRGWFFTSAYAQAYKAQVKTAAINISINRNIRRTNPLIFTSNAFDISVSTRKMNSSGWFSVFLVLMLMSNALLVKISWFVRLRGCLHDTGATFAPERVHSGSLSWLYICLHGTTTKCYAGASHPGVSSPRFSHRGENFTPVRNLATVSCKRENDHPFRCEIGLPVDWNG